MTRSLDGGYLANKPASRRGRASSSPPQLGHVPRRCSRAQRLQTVHSKLQIIASPESGGRSVAQHSQQGLSFSMAGI
jgi:hypothetical protein